MTPVCEANQWPRDAFWWNVDMAAHLVEAELTDPINLEEITKMILSSWLDYATQAGNA